MSDPYTEAQQIIGKNTVYAHMLITLAMISGIIIGAFAVGAPRWFGSNADLHPKVRQSLAQYNLTVCRQKREVK